MVAVAPRGGGSDMRAPTCTVTSGVGLVPVSRVYLSNVDQIPSIVGDMWMLSGGWQNSLVPVPRSA